MSSEDPTHLDESDWIRHRIWRLMLLRREVTHARALAVIDELITEAEQRLERIVQSACD